MEGKTLFLKFNTGPSGHGIAAGGRRGDGAEARRRRRGQGLRRRGRGRPDARRRHETKNTAWGLGLDNLLYLIDWNDYGIDERPLSAVVNGTPSDWFEPYGLRVTAPSRAPSGRRHARLSRSARGAEPRAAPEHDLVQDAARAAATAYGYKSHGTPAQAERARVLGSAQGVHRQVRRRRTRASTRPRPADAGELRAQFEANLKAIADTITSDDALVRLPGRPAGRAAATRCRRRSDGFSLDTTDEPRGKDKRLWDFKNYPEEICRRSRAPTRPTARPSAKWGAWVNSFGRKDYGRPLFLAHVGRPGGVDQHRRLRRRLRRRAGLGPLRPRHEPRGRAAAAGDHRVHQLRAHRRASPRVNLSADPFEEFDGFYAAHSTYALVQLPEVRPDAPVQPDRPGLATSRSARCSGWPATPGPRRPRTRAPTSASTRPGVMQLFPEGHVINLIPWEHNEVPVHDRRGDGAPTRTIVALHLTRPPIQIPDRAALGMASHFEAAKGAYLIRDYKPGQPKRRHDLGPGHDVDLQHGRAPAEAGRARPERQDGGGVSPELFKLQDAELPGRRSSPPGDRWDDMTHHQPRARLMRDWVDAPIADEYAMSSDWDNRWRTGGTVDEVMDEAHLWPDSHPGGHQRFVDEREIRLTRLREMAQTSPPHTPAKSGWPPARRRTPFSDPGPRDPWSSERRRSQASVRPSWSR